MLANKYIMGNWSNEETERRKIAADYKPYDPKDMEMKMPLGCKIIPLVFLGVIILAIWWGCS